MSKVDWSLAPEGATHKDFTECGLWYKFDIEKNTVSYWNSNRCGYWSMSGTPAQYEDGSMEHMEPKPWSGPEDGLPPVGVECEVDHGNGKHWDKVTILAHHGEKAIYLDPIRGIHYIWGLLKDFRTIRTEEQLAAEQRETAIADMAKVLPGAKNECYTFNDDGSVRPYAHIHDVLGLLVDAGFKREVV